MGEARTRWIVSQIGARQHYGIPRGFLPDSALRLLYTEAWCRWGSSLLMRGNSHMRAFAGRRHGDIPNKLVVSFNGDELRRQLFHRSNNITLEAEYLEYLRIGQWFATKVASDLSHRNLDAQQDVFFGFNTGCLETLQLMKEHGVVTICDQIDPAQVEEDMVEQECQKWPGWQKQAGRIPGAYWERMHQEWEAASMVLVNSQWSKDALIQQGVPADKMFIVPVAYEAGPVALPPRNNVDGPLTVLWIGSVNLRKGIQYLIGAARQLVDNPRIVFVVAGPLQISQQATDSAPKNMTFVGRITREEAAQMYLNGDVFVIPTVSDGFAITQVEAMAHAMPVITTPHCGKVVTDGVDGLIVPACDSNALANAIAKLDADRTLLQQMSHKAVEKSRQFHLSTQTCLIKQAVADFRKNQNATR